MQAHETYEMAGSPSAQPAEPEAIDTPTGAAEFWDRKILSWEGDRYGRPSTPGLVEAIARRFSASIVWRLRLGLAHLMPHLAGQRVLELGCGSARLAEALLDAGAASYHGIDFAPSAILAARRRLRAEGLAERAVVETADVLDGPLPRADLVFSLGLLDWLEDSQIDQLFRRTAGQRFLHAFSERRASPSQFIHRAYVQLAYGRRAGAYVPRYLDLDRVLRVPRESGSGPIAIVRDPRLSFGVFVTDLKPARRPTATAPRRPPVAGHGAVDGGRA